MSPLLTPHQREKIMKISHVVLLVNLAAATLLTGCEASKPATEANAQPVVAAPAAATEAAAPAPVATPTPAVEPKHCDKHHAASDEHDCIAHCAKSKGKKNKACIKHCKSHVAPHHDCAKHCADHPAEKDKACAEHCAQDTNAPAHQCHTEHCDHHASAAAKTCDTGHCAHHKGGAAHQCGTEHCEAHGGNMADCCGDAHKCDM